MAEMTQLMRQWRLLQMLSRRGQGVPLRDMAEETGVETRTILRDLNVLRNAGFPLAEHVKERGKKFWYLSREDGIGQLQFTLEEASALYLGRQYLDAFAGTLFWSGAQSGFGKIRAVLGETTVEHLDKLAEATHMTSISQADYSARAEMIDDLMVGIEDCKVTVITYQSLRSTEPVTHYNVHPYAMVFHKGALYLIAWSVDHSAIRTFKVDRISEVEVKGGLLKFERPERFDPGQYLEHSFGIFADEGPPQTVRVKFSAAVRRILEEKKFHPSQELRPQPDGGVVACFQLATFEEFRSFVLSFGRHAKVLEPKELADDIRQEIFEMQAMYPAPQRNGHVRHSDVT